MTARDPLLIACAGLLAALAGADEWADRKAAIASNLAGADPDGRRRGLEMIAAFDSPEAADLLLASTAAAARRIETEILPYAASLDSRLRRSFVQLGSTLRSPLGVLLYDTKRSEIDRNLESVEARESLERETMDRAGAILGRMRSPGAVARLLEASRRKGPWRARRAIAAGLGGLDDPQATPRLAEILAARREDVTVRIAAAEALATRPSAEALPWLLDALPRSPAPLQWAILRALEALDDPAAVPPLIASLKGAGGRTRDATRSALARLTGRFDLDAPAAWEAWWAESGAGLADSRGDRAARIPAPARRPGDVDTVPTFLGLPVTGRAVVFIVDCSISMNEPVPPGDPVAGALPGKTTRRFDLARQELDRTLRALPEGTRFNILAFDRVVKPFQPNGLLPATPANVRKAREWMAGVELGYATSLYEALECALEPGRGPGGDVDPLQAADSAFVLSDGEPTSGPLVSGFSIRQRVRDLNLAARVALHSVAIAPDARSGAFLKALAEENGGQYLARGRRVPRPEQ